MPAVCAVEPLKLIIDPATVANVPPLEKFPPILSVPAPVNVSLACAAVPENVIAPVQLIVPVETETVQNRLAVPLPGIAMLAAFNVPAPTEIVLVITPADGAFIVIAPVAFSVFVPFIVIPLFAAGAFITIVVTAAVLTSTVTVIPELTTTASPATGTGLPPQVAVALQLPDNDYKRQLPK